MRITLILVGKTVNKHFVELIDEYAGRMKHYVGFDITVIPELKNTKSLSAEQQKQQEGELILKQLQAGDHVVLLDEHGKELRSVEFSRWMEQKMQTVGKRLVFIIGGPYGFSPEVYAKANEKLSATVDACFTMVQYSYPVQRGLQVNDIGYVEMTNPEYLRTRSQDLKTTANWSTDYSHRRFGQS